MDRLRVYPAVPVITRSDVVLPVRELDHEALPGRIEIPLAGVFGAGEAISRCQLERAESAGVADRTVLACAEPYRATYRGRGDPMDASTWECVATGGGRRKPL